MSRIMELHDQKSDFIINLIIMSQATVIALRPHTDTEAAAFADVSVLYVC
jgi:hypothetical protein